jgi:hypothetical protein
MPKTIRQARRRSAGLTINQKTAHQFLGISLPTFYLRRDEGQFNAAIVTRAVGKQAVNRKTGKPIKPRITIRLNLEKLKQLSLSISERPGGSEDKK